MRPRMSPRVAVILNPAAGKGRGARAEPGVRRAFAAAGVADVRVTSAAGGEREAARRAIDDGADTLVAVGGDGTWGNVANAILAAGADVRLALCAAGTGNDFAKTVGAPAADFAATARLAVDGPDARVDVGRIEGRHFLNVAGFGFDIAVIEDVARSTRLRGQLAYPVSALRQLFGYGGLPIEVAGDGAGTGAGNGAGAARHLMLIVANGRHFGGAFRIAPGASLVDGRLDAVAVRDASTLQRVQLFGAIARGAHVGHPSVRVEQAPAFTLAFPAPPAYETDGEYNRAASATLEVRCVPRALRVVTPLAAELAAAAAPAAAPPNASAAAGRRAPGVPA
jgi:diacylglycerol kinase (ATP)